jgi:tryptophan synthase alpha chain
MSISTLFSQLESMRNTIKLPVVLMGYMNPVLQYGFEKFCADAAAAHNITVRASDVFFMRFGP